MTLLTAKIGDEVLCDIKDVLWCSDINVDELFMETDGLKTTNYPITEWYKVVHILDSSTTSGIYGWSWLGKPLYCLIEIPITSIIYKFNKRFDINEKVYNQDVVSYYKIDPSLHGKVVADIFQFSIKEVR